MCRWARRSEWLLLIIVVLSISCGTINQRKLIIPIDSNPRDIKIFDKHNKYIGTTPLFHVISKKRNQKFKFISEEYKIKYKHSYKCKINYSESFVPNLVLSPIFPTGTLIGAIAVSIDYWTGNLFKCSNKINIKFKHQKSFKSTVKKILILPIASLDEKDGRKILTKWKNLYFNKQQKDLLIPIKKGLRSMAYYGLSNEHEWDPKKINKNDIWSLGHEFKATHILYFKLKNGTHYQPELYDIFSLEKVEEPYLMPIKKLSSNNVFSSYNFIKNSLIRTFSFIPNSISANLLFNQKIHLMSINQEDINGLDVDRHPKSFPRFFSIWSVENITNPYLYKAWDYNFKFSPSLAINAWQGDININSVEFQLQAQALILGYKGSFYFHSPFGSIGASVGVGYGYFYSKDNLGNKFIFYEFPMLTDIFFYKFFTDNLYFKFGVSYFGFDQEKKSISNSYMYLKDWSEIVISLGYYIPTMKSVIRDLLPF